METIQQEDKQCLSQTVDKYVRQSFLYVVKYKCEKRLFCPKHCHAFRFYYAKNGIIIVGKKQEKNYGNDKTQC